VLLQGKTVLITGVGSGLGRECATAALREGANVVLAARTKEQLEEVASGVAERGRRAAVVPCDLSDTDNLNGLVETAMSEFGRVDIVVNNVGGTEPRPFLDTSEGFFERAFHFNVTTAFVLSKAAVPHMLEGDGGAIVNISSAMGRFRDRGYVAYGTAKAALAHMTRLMAADLAPKVRVNAIAVGSVATSALETVLTNDDLHRQMVEATPLKRLGEVEDIAATALWLASPAGSFVTGKVVEVDGGIEAPNLPLGLADL